MKHVFVLAVASLIATSANAAEMKWNGSAEWRYSQTKNTEALARTVSVAGTQKATNEVTNKAHQIRGNVGLTGGWEHIEYGIGIRSGGSGVKNDDHGTFQNFGDFGVGLEQGWIRYVRDFGSLDMSATFGRQKNVFAYDTFAQNFFDNDVRLDGAGWKFKFGMFGLNAGQYILGSHNQSATSNATASYYETDQTKATAGTPSRFDTLFGFQPHMNWKFSDDIETQFAVGYYVWAYDGSNRTRGGISSTAETLQQALVTGTGAAPLSAVSFKVNNARQWQFLNTWSLPYNLKFVGELVLNKKYYYDTFTNAGYLSTTKKPEAAHSALTLGLTYGALKKAQDFTLGYAYVKKGIAASLNDFANEAIAADNKGHVFNLGYAVADNFHLNWSGVFLKEHGKIAVGDTVANDGATYAGTHAGQEAKTSYWELTAGLMF